MAQGLVGKFLNIPIPSAEFVEHYDGGNKFIKLTKGPISALTSVYDEYLEETVDADDYRLDDELDLIIWKHGNWHAGYKRFKVTYTAGWDASDIPDAVDGAIDAIEVALENQTAEGSLKNSETLGDYSYSKKSKAYEVLFSFENVLNMYKRY